MLQGMIKHIIQWLISIHQEKITCLPVLLGANISYIGLHSNGRQVLFSWCIWAKGHQHIMLLSYTTQPQDPAVHKRDFDAFSGLGDEHKKMCCILFKLVLNLPVSGGWDPSCLIKAVHGLLDFLYLTQYPCYTTDIILQLQDCISIFYDNKQVLINIGVWKHINRVIQAWKSNQGCLFLCSFSSSFLLSF